MITPSYSITATERVLPKLALDFTTASLDPRVTFTRAGNTATVVNSSGYVTPINADLPRFDYNPITLVCKGLLIEESRTNLFTYSAQFDDAIWVKGTNILPAPTVTADTSISPSGTLTADTYTRNSTGENRLRYTTTQAVSTSYVLSVFAKAGNVSFLRLRNLAQATETNTWFNLSNGTVGTISAGTSSASITSFGNGWYRCSITVTTSATIANNFIDIANAASDGSISGSAGNTTIIWGAQLEAGAFATSYIPTVASQVTRTADVATMTSTNFSSWYSAGAGGVVARVLPSTVSGTRPALQFDDNTANELINLRGNTTNPELVIVDGGSPQVQIDAGTIAANTVYSLGAAWNTDNCAAAVNGDAAVTDATATIPTVTQARLGSNGTDYLNGHLQNLRYWPQRIINAEVQAFSK